jgi:nucleotide-binding universal stress UspA family protein
VCQLVAANQIDRVTVGTGAMREVWPAPWWTWWGRSRLDSMTGIMVGVDGSSNAGAALRWAAVVAGRRGSPLTAVLAWNTLDQHHPDGEPRLKPDYGSDDAMAALDAYVRTALGSDGAEAVERSVVAGHAAEVLTEAARGASLLVVGARGLGPLRSALLGSVSQYAAQSSACPVAIVRGHEPPEVKDGGRIVVGFDGSESSRRALGWALDEARRCGAVVRLVHVWQLPYYGTDVLGVVPSSETLEQAARSMVDEALAEADTDGLVRPVESVVVPGSPTERLLAEATGADAVVVGSRGRGGFAGLLLGSVSQQLANYADCPAVIVRSVH